MTTKRLDCIRMKRSSQKRIREQVGGMTSAEEHAFFRQGAEEFERRIERTKEAAVARTARRQE